MPMACPSVCSGSVGKAIEVNPAFAPAKYNLGKLLISTGNNDEGSKLLAEAITLDPTLAPEG